MAFAADDRLAELTQQESRTLEHLESSRQELAGLREQIRSAQKTLRCQRTQLAVDQYQQECQTGDAERGLAERSHRLVSLWRLFKKRIRGERAAIANHLAQESAALDQRARQLDEADARLALREALLQRGEQRLERQARQHMQQARRLSTASTESEQHERRIEELRTEIAGLEMRAEHLRGCQARPAELSVAYASGSDDNALADLRQRLLENWGELLTACSTWAENQFDTANVLAQIEQQLFDKAGAIAQTMTDVTARQWALERAEETLAARERRSNQRALALAELYETWSTRLRAEQAALATERQDTAAARERWVELHDIGLRLRRELHERECAVATRELAVERVHQEVIDTADSPSAVARRLERLHCQWLASYASDENEFARLAELIDDRLTELQQQEQRVAEREGQADQRIARRLEQLAALERRMVPGSTSAVVNDRMDSPTLASSARAA